MKYDHADFKANPDKYRLFSTAEIATHFFTENGADDLREGEIVAIKFRCVAPNRLRMRMEPVYTVKGRDVYASALRRFVL